MQNAPMPSTPEAKLNSGGRFPSEFVDPMEKKSEAYCLKFAEAFYGECNHEPTHAGLLRNNRNYTRYRQYGRGEQPPEQYKELAGLKKEKGALNTSFRNLNFDVLKVVPKIRGVLINKIVGNNYNLLVKPIDPFGMNARRTEKFKIQEFIMNQDQIQQFEHLTKLGLEKPSAPGEQLPTNMKEVDPYLDMNPKDAAAMEVKDYLTWNFMYNDWNQIGEECAGDFVDVGVAGTRPFVDANSMVRLRRIIPERCVTNKCIYPDFRDMIRFGEFYEITVSDYRKMTKGKKGTDHYRMVADKWTKNGMGKYADVNQNYYNDTSYSYAYDSERMTVIDMLWYSTDTEVYVQMKNEAGNTRIKTKAFDYSPFKGDMTVNEGKGVSDEEFTNLTGKKIFRKEVKNVYKCTWIVGSNIVFNNGLMENMPRTVTNPDDTKIPVTLLTLDFMSPIGNIEPLADEVQMNWLQFQSHIAASKPPGVAIERKALARLGKGGQGGMQWDPKEDLMMFAESGNIVFDGYDAHGNALNHIPIMPMTNGLSPAAGEHWTIMLGLIDLIRSTLGLNPLTEGQAPPERLGKYVAQLSFTATDNALAHMINAYRKLFERTAQMTYYMLQSAVTMADQEQITEALGLESYRYFQLNKDLGLRDMGISIEEGADVYLREKISIHLQKAVDNKEMAAEDAIEIEREENLYRSVVLMRKRKREKEDREHARQMELVEQQSKTQGEATVQVEQAKKDMRAEEIDKEKELLVIKHNLDLELNAQKFMQERYLRRAEQAQDVDENETAFIQEMMKISLKGKFDIQKANSKPQTSTK
jgi:hypothetical protein